MCFFAIHLVGHWKMLRNVYNLIFSVALINVLLSWKLTRLIKIKLWKNYFF